MSPNPLQMTAGPRANYSQTLNDAIITDSDAQVHLRTVVQDEHQCTTNAADDVCNETLEQAGCETFFSGNLLETMHGVETTELQTTVTDDAHDGHTETSVKSHRSTRACSCL